MGHDIDRLRDNGMPFTTMAAIYIGALRMAIREHYQQKQKWPDAIRINPRVRSEMLASDDAQKWFTHGPDQTLRFEGFPIYGDQSVETFILEE